MYMYVDSILRSDQVKFAIVQFCSSVESSVSCVEVFLRSVVHGGGGGGGGIYEGGLYTVECQ